jgi:hypothetical protein
MTLACSSGILKEWDCHESHTYATETIQCHNDPDDEVVAVQAKQITQPSYPCQHCGSNEDDTTVGQTPRQTATKFTKNLVIHVVCTG